MKYDSLWNVDLTKNQQDRVARSAPQFIPVCEMVFGDKPISILEIGVFRGGLTELFRNSKLNIQTYVGIDPFGGTGDDPYIGSYWKGQEEAQRVYEETAAKFRNWGFDLQRTNSRQYLGNLHPDIYYDLIYVDGDHRFPHAYWDMCAAIPHVSSTGLLAVDDYANCDVPEVTTALNQFLTYHSLNILRAGYVENSFVNAGKSVPLVQRTVYIQPQAIESRVTLPLPVIDCQCLAPRSILYKIMDVSPRLLFHWFRGAIK